MAVLFSNTKFRVPQGFRNLLWVLNKEVLRDAPDDITAYSADFFQKLLQIRAETGHDPARHGAHSEDRFYNNFVFRDLSQQTAEAADKQAEAAPEHDEPSTAPRTDDTAATEEVVDLDLSDPALEEAAFKIQAQFRGFQVRRRQSHGDNGGNNGETH